MKFCQDHWDKLRAAISAEGLDDLVAPDGQTAAAQLAAEVTRGETDVTTFDPLMGAHWAIVGRISERAPGVIFQPGCPICWVQDAHEANCHDDACGVTRQTFEDWIPGVAAHMRTEWERIKEGAA